jgi:hypothetical protein
VDRVPATAAGHARVSANGFGHQQACECRWTERMARVRPNTTTRRMPAGGLHSLLHFSLAGRSGPIDPHHPVGSRDNGDGRTAVDRTLAGRQKIIDADE